jgi:murein L,D-transpeptidase YcbB/YkuD
MQMNNRLTKNSTMRTLVSRGVLVTTLLLAGVFPVGATQLIESHMAQLREQGRLTLGGQQLAAVRALPAFYAARNYQPVWSSGDRARDMLKLIEAAIADGLNPADYHAGALQALAARSELSEEEGARQELLLTDALMRWVYHLEFGKVDAEKLYNNWQFGKSIDGLDPVGLIETIVNAPDLSASIDAHRPQHPVYARLQEALAHYQQLADAGGWKSMPAGPTLKTGMQGPRVRSLRQRLMVSGDLASDLTVTELFDAALEAAVKRFQKRHRLNPDGAVGEGTLEALNVSAGKRVDQLRVNLERARWILHDISAEMIIADIAGFEVFEIRNGDITWRTRAQVGKTYRKTPVFKSEIKYLEFNPTWNLDDPADHPAQGHPAQGQEGSWVSERQGYPRPRSTGPQHRCRCNRLVALSGGGLSLYPAPGPGPEECPGPDQVYLPEPAFCLYARYAQQGAFRS